MRYVAKTWLLVMIGIVAIGQAWAEAPANYYASATGKQDEALMTALKDIIYSHTALSYSALWNAFKTTDTDDDGYIIDMYSDYKYLPSEHGASATGIGQGYNREHSFPKSWFNGNTPMYTDLFHLYPTDIRVNSQRSNYPFGVCAGGTRLTTGSYTAKGRLGTSTYSGYSGTVFEPDDEYKGDFARSYFYMVTCYKDQLPSWPGSNQLDYATNGYKAFSTWSINMLMEWHRLDPVSEKEVKRNDAVYSLQKNRNPFIDHPELAEYIWGDQQGQTWSESGSDVTPAITTPADGTTLDMGTTTIGTELELTLTLKGEGLTQGLTMSMSDNEYFYVSRSSFTASAVNVGTTFTITFTADDAGHFANQIILSSGEVSTTFTVTATATTEDDPIDPSERGEATTEDWETCSTGGYWTSTVQGHTWQWSFTDAGIWGDNLRHDELSCRLGKTSSSAIAMAEDVSTGASAFEFYAGAYGSDSDATLRIDYSTNQGASWTTLGNVAVTSGSLQSYLLHAAIEGTVRFRIVQTAGKRVNIDDISIYAAVSTPISGDVNGDGLVSVADINAIIDLILRNLYDSSGDVNGDGIVSVADINAVINIMLAD